MTRVYKFLFLNVFLLTWLTGCVSGAPRVVTPDGFGLKGKVAVKDANEQFSANILWQQEGEDFEIDLWGPLGQGRVQLKRQGQRVALLNGQGEVLSEGDSEAVMRARLGWSLPMDVLPAWVQGAPLSGVAAENLNFGSEGLLATFDQLGWHVVLDRYRSVPDGPLERSLPGRVTAENGAVRVRLVISDWQI